MNNNVDFETPSDFVSSEAALSLAGPRKPVTKPDISFLPDAIVGGEPQFDVGDHIVVERYASFLKGKPYLDTKTFRVVSLDNFTGRLHLFDELLDQNAIMNWKESLRHGTVFKLKQGRLTISSKGKRGRPRKNPLPVPVPIVDGVPLPKKKGRGRPKGSKNRPSDVIKAEKAAVKAQRSIKKAARMAKKKPKTR